MRTYKELMAEYKENRDNANTQEAREYWQEVIDDLVELKRESITDNG